MMRCSILWFGLAALALMGCGKSLTPMTPEQKSRFVDTLGHVGNVSSGIGSARSGHGNGFAPLAAVAPWLAASPSPSPAVPTDSERQQLANQLAAAIQSGQCRESDNMPSEFSGLSSFRSLSFTIGGDHCPIQFGLTASASGSPQDASGQFAVTYRVTDDTFRAIADIDSMSLNGSLEAHSDQGSQSGKFSLDGSLHSRKEGDLKLYLNGDGEMSRDGFQQAGDAEVAFGIQFSDFTGEIKVKASGSSPGSNGSNLTYYVNDQEVDSNEFQTYVTALNLRLSQFGRTGN
jgi:hypothetical protein